jgi:hypothetical protein
MHGDSVKIFRHSFRVADSTLYTIRYKPWIKLGRRFRGTIRPRLDWPTKVLGIVVDFALSPVIPPPDLRRRQDDLAIPFHLAAELKPYGMNVSAGRTLIIRRLGHLVAAHQPDLVIEAHEQLVRRLIFALGVKDDRVRYHTIQSL